MNTPSKDDEHMFVGQSLFGPFGSEEEVLGWAGHSADGGHFTVEGK